MLKQYGKLRIFQDKTKESTTYGQDLSFSSKDCIVKQNFTILLNGIAMRPLYHSFSYDFKGCWTKISILSNDL